MQNFLRRHRILVGFTLFAVVLVLIGWSVRPDLSTGNTAIDESAPAQRSE